MKNYGAMKATEFTKKQIGVIYSKAKKGELKIEKWVMTEFYDLADYYGYDSNKSVEDRENEILLIIDHMFAGDIEDVQERIDSYTERHFELLSNKAKVNACRDLVK
jgi:hypothetical protein